MSSRGSKLWASNVCVRGTAFTVKEGSVVAYDQEVALVEGPVKECKLSFGKFFPGLRGVEEFALGEGESISLFEARRESGYSTDGAAESPDRDGML